jgi:hypothetical protein
MEHTITQAPILRPSYEALDGTGRPYNRDARVIHELPTLQHRIEALADATALIVSLLGMPARHRINFGAPAYRAFMEYAEAKRHVHRELLLKHGSDLSLDLCPRLYLPAGVAAT